MKKVGVPMEYKDKLYYECQNYNYDLEQNDYELYEEYFKGNPKRVNPIKKFDLGKRDSRKTNKINKKNGNKK